VNGEICCRFYFTHLSSVVQVYRDVVVGEGFMENKKATCVVNVKG
jgi:hypothetical protein